MKKLLLAAALIALAGAPLTATPANAERWYITPSGLPETVFVNTANEDAAEKLAAVCARRSASSYHRRQIIHDDI